MISVGDLLKELICISEKSSQISRICRAESGGLFKMLIQEKTNVDGKNPRFQHDYKTFADVLIQQMAVFCLEAKFPGLSKKIYGEETNQFENKLLGQYMSIHIDTDPVVTHEMLVKILNGNIQLAKQLIQVIYSDDDDFDHLINQINDFPDMLLKQSDIGIWIDPIDSTSEYIKGYWPNTDDDSGSTLAPKGLHCVTCLFGVFDINTGIPLLGVVNQPFYKRLNECSFEGRCIWGFHINKVSQNNIQQQSSFHDNLSGKKCQVILVGGKEKQELKEKLNRTSMAMYVAGAGHKLLNVATGQADLLLTSSKSTYFWDTCAAHAILRSLGGGIIPFDNYNQLDVDNLDQEQLEKFQIRYKEKTTHTKNSECNHSKGLIAYRNVETLRKTLNHLKTS